MENDLQLNVLASRIPRAVDSVPVCLVASGVIGQRFVWPAFCLAGVLFGRRSSVWRDVSGRFGGNENMSEINQLAQFAAYCRILESIQGTLDDPAAAHNDSGFRW